MGIELAKAYVTVVASTEEAKASLDGVTRSLDGMAKKGSVLAQVESEFADAQRRAAEITMQVATAAEARKRKQSELTDVMDRGLISETTYSRALRDLRVGELRSLSGQLSEVGSVATLTGGLITAAFGMSAKSAVMAAGKYEQTMIAFETMMQSTSKATGLLNDLTKFAAETPFEMPEIEQVARGMVMFGEDSKTLMDTLKMLGNAASGTSSSFGMLGLVYNQIRGVGKLLTQDFRQLSTRGVISLRDIAKHYKITDAAAQDMLSKGKVSFEDFRSIMLNLAGEGGTGRFAGMMKKQSESMLGLLSTFSDSWRIAMRQIGEELVPVGKWFVKLGVDALSAFSGMDSATKKLIAGTIGVGTVLGGLFTTISAGAFVTGKLITAYASTTEILSKYAMVCKAASLAQSGFNAVCISTPYLLGAIASAAALVIGYKLGQWMVDQTDKAKKFNKVLKEQKDQLEFEKGVGVDFGGASEEEVKNFIETTMSGIGQAKERLKEMEKAWFGNNDAIALTKDQIAQLEDQLGKANEKLLGFAKSEGLPGLNKQIADTEANIKRLKTEIEGTAARLGESMAKPHQEGAIGRWQDKDMLAQEEAWRKKIEANRAEMDNESNRSNKLRVERANAVADVDEKATEKIKEKIEALQIEADTYGMTAAEVAYYKDISDKVDPNVAAEHAKAIEAAEDQKRQEEEKNKLAEERFKYLSAEAIAVERLAQKEREAAEWESARREEPDGSAEYEKAMSDVEYAVDLAMTPMDRLQEQIKRVDDAFKTGLISADLYKQSMLGLGRSLEESVMTPSEKATRQISEWKQMLDNGAISQETYTRLLKKMGQSVRDSVSPKEALNSKIREYDALLKVGAITQDEYNKAVWEAKRANEAFGMSSGFAEFGQRIQEAIMKSGPAAVGSVAGVPTAVGSVAGVPAAIPASTSDFDNAFVPSLGSTADFDNAFRSPIKDRQDDIVTALIEGNKKTEQIVSALKNPPKQPMVLQ